ncbi:hypothetical protein PF003_g29802 [Phytophthora fragariae]|nr:hypothetical protein PF003_g29802 [Phytophthora fragariae]
MALVAVLTLFCIAFVYGSGVEAGGGVRARAWQAAAPQQQGSWLLVACMTALAVLTDLYCFAYCCCSGVRHA